MTKISVVCPTYNSENFVEKTLFSVFQQTRLPDELILIDDGSNDSTVSLLRNLISNYGEHIKCMIIENNHRGPGAARNTGIMAATGDWVAFLDSDDLWYPQKLAEAESRLRECPGVNFLCHNEISKLVSGSEKRLEYDKKYNVTRPLPQQLFHANLFSTSAVICKRQILVDSNGFDEHLMSAQDYELWLRLSPSINVMFINRILGEYVHRSGNITSRNYKNRFKNEVKIAFKHRHLVNRPRLLLRLLRIVISFSLQLIRAQK